MLHSQAIAFPPGGRGLGVIWGPGQPRLTHPPTHPHQKTILIPRERMKFIKGSGDLRPILGTQTFGGPLTPPPGGCGLFTALELHACYVHNVSLGPRALNSGWHKYIIRSAVKHNFTIPKLCCLVDGDMDAGGNTSTHLYVQPVPTTMPYAP